MLIRRALPCDSGAVCDLLIRSITFCCGDDHGHDPVLLARWTRNKTPEQMEAWINDPETALFVAEKNGQIIAVASVLRSGEIALNYIDPAYRRQGISKAMLLRLEDQARAWGLGACFLSSTKTARGFYHAMGYRESAEKRGSFAPVVFEMNKEI